MKDKGILRTGFLFLTTAFLAVNYPSQSTADNDINNAAEAPTKIAATTPITSPFGVWDTPDIVGKAGRGRVRAFKCEEAPESVCLEVHCDETTAQDDCQKAIGQLDPKGNFTWSGNLIDPRTKATLLERITSGFQNLGSRAVAAMGGELCTLKLDASNPSLATLKTPKGDANWTRPDSSSEITIATLTP